MKKYHSINQKRDALNNITIDGWRYVHGLEDDLKKEKNPKKRAKLEAEIKNRRNALIDKEIYLIRRY